MMGELMDMRHGARSRSDPPKHSGSLPSSAAGRFHRKPV